ncbi:unnamed protein product [Sphacelaria rigidula]
MSTRNKQWRRRLIPHHPPTTIITCQHTPGRSHRPHLHIKYLVTYEMVHEIPTTVAPPWPYTRRTSLFEEQGTTFKGSSPKWHCILSRHTYFKLP